LSSEGREIPFPSSKRLSSDEEFESRTSEFCSKLLAASKIDERTGNYFCLIEPVSATGDNFVGRLVDGYLASRLPAYETQCAILPHSTHAEINPKFFADLFKPPEDWSSMASIEMAMKGTTRAPSEPRW